jgi:signal transduction histidine kinase
VERQKAERLAREAETMLKDLVTAERDKMNRVVNLMGGIAHEVGNPLTTLSAEVDGLESSPPVVGSADAKRRIDNLRNALRRLETFLHDITAFSYQDDDRVGNLDINETIRALTGLVQLDDRARRATFALLLSPDVCSLPLPRQPVSLALFIIFSTAAEELNGIPGEIEVRTRLAPSGETVEVQVVTSRLGPPVNGSDPTAGVGNGQSSRSALEAATGLMASLGGQVRVSPQQGNKTTWVLDLPRRVEAPRARKSPT